MKRRLNFLSSIDIFENLTIKNINSLLDCIIIEYYKPKDILCLEGTIGNKFFIIESGVARIFSHNK